MTKRRIQIGRISANHEAISNWLIANPGKAHMGACAAHFDISRAWLSTLIHTDAFKAMMAAKQERLFDGVIIPLSEKIHGLAHASIDKLGDVLEETKDERLVKEIAKDSMAYLGFGANTSVVVNNTQNNQTNLRVDSAALAKARELNINRRQKEAVLENNSEPAQLAAPNQASELSRDPEFGMGETCDVRTINAYSEKAVHGGETPGDKV